MLDIIDLRTPRDSPSMTLARLRVIEKCDDPPGNVPIRPSSSLGISRLQEFHGRSCIPQSELFKIHLNPQQSLSKPRCISSSLKRSFEAKPGHVLHLYDRYYSRTRHSSPFPPESVTDYAPQRSILRKHLSLSSVSPSNDYFVSIHSQGEHSQGECLPVSHHGSSAAGFSSQNRMFRHPACPREISSVGSSMRIIDQERTTFARHGGAAHQGIISTSRTQESPLSKYECGYCGKGFNRPSSLKASLDPVLLDTC